jgi:hypothetical protein
MYIFEVQEFCASKLLHFHTYQPLSLREIYIMLGGNTVQNCGRDSVVTDLEGSTCKIVRLNVCLCLEFLAYELQLAILASGGP